MARFRNYMRCFYLDEQLIEVPILSDVPARPRCSTIFEYYIINNLIKISPKCPIDSPQTAVSQVVKKEGQIEGSIIQILISKIYQIYSSPIMVRSTRLVLGHHLMKVSLLLFLVFCLVSANDQLVINLASSGSIPVVIFNSSATPPLNSSFVEMSNTFNCSLSPLYTYKQSDQQYKNNSPYFLTINSTSTQAISVQISTQYNSISPTINNSKQITCSSYPCSLQIQNYCKLPKLNYFDYFDVVRLNISSLDTILSYYVLCHIDFQGNSFEYGLLIEIFSCTILITIVALYSNAWSIGGAGWQINLPIVLFFNALLIIGGIVGVFAFQVVSIAVNVLSWGFGIAAVWLCINQLLFLIKAATILRFPLFQVKGVSVRVLDLVSLVGSLGVCFAWWFSSKNWIVNDVIAVSMIIAAIKVFKFTSLKQALICFCVTIGVQMVFVLVLTFYIKKSYNTIILNIFNNPFQLQIPTINPVYNQKCAWLPVTALIFPGALMSYMRRFDSSRNTKVYIITCVCIFLIGSMVWMLISIASEDSWPFGLIAEPATLGFISFFAWKRKQIRTLWTGKFYDQQFVHKQGLKTIGQSVQRERDKTQIVYSPDLFAGLHMKDQQSFIDGPDQFKLQKQVSHMGKYAPQLQVESKLDQSLISEKSAQTSVFKKIQLTKILPQNEDERKEKKEPSQNLPFGKKNSKFPMVLQKGAI